MEQEAKKLKWLISNEDFDTITNGGEYDWVMEVFNENGMTSEDDSFWKFYYTRFEYCWPDCPKCGTSSKDHYVLGKESWQCRNSKCRHKFTISSGTYLDNTRIEWHRWFRFAYLIGEMGVTNSCVIARDLQVTQKTAWWMINTLRTARKETSETKFVNGQEVLVFGNHWLVIETLLQRKKSIIEVPNLEEKFVG